MVRTSKAPADSSMSHALSWILQTESSDFLFLRRIWEISFIGHPCRTACIHSCYLPPTPDLGRCTNKLLITSYKIRWSPGSILIFKVTADHDTDDVMSMITVLVLGKQNFRRIRWTFISSVVLSRHNLLSPSYVCVMRKHRLAWYLKSMWGEKMIDGA